MQEDFEGVRKVCEVLVGVGEGGGRGKEASREQSAENVGEDELGLPGVSMRSDGGNTPTD